MKKHSMPEMKESGVNVTPLIDVVMCLIIFFMLVAKIGVKTGAAKLELPKTIEGKKIEELGDSIILNVTDPNIDRMSDGSTPKRTPEGDPNGAVVMLSSHINEPHVTARFNDNDPDAVEVPIVRKSMGGGNVSYPLREGLARAVDDRKKKGKDKDFSVTIRAERDLDYSMLQQVLMECAAAGVRTLNYGSIGRLSTDAPAKH